MKSAARLCSPAGAGIFVLALLLSVEIAHPQNEPILVPDAIDYQKLLPILPEAPQGWTTDKPEGSTEDVGGVRVTNVQRAYPKGGGGQTPTVPLSILHLVANPGYRSAPHAAWDKNSENRGGYSKTVTTD